MELISNNSESVCQHKITVFHQGYKTCVNCGFVFDEKQFFSNFESNYKLKLKDDRIKGNLTISPTYSLISKTQNRFYPKSNKLLERLDKWKEFDSVMLNAHNIIKRFEFSHSKHYDILLLYKQYRKKFGIWGGLNHTIISCCIQTIIKNNPPYLNIRQIAQIMGIDHKQLIKKRTEIKRNISNLLNKTIENPALEVVFNQIYYKMGLVNERVRRVGYGFCQRLDGKIPFSYSIIPFASAIYFILMKRKGLDLTQAQVCKTIGVNYVNLSNYVRKIENRILNRNK